MPITGPVGYWFNALQWYKGTQTGDDGLYDTSWTTNYLDPSIRKLTGIPAFTQAWLLNAGQQSSMTFVGDPFNRFVFAAVSNPCGSGSSCSNGASIYDLGQYPWASAGVPTLVGGFNRDVQRFPYSQPGFPQLVMSSYTKIDSTHASLRVQGSGMGSMNNPAGVGPGTPPNWMQDDYTTWLRDYTMVAGAPPVEPTDLAGADLDYRFDSYTGDVNLYDHSGNNHTATDDNGHPYAFDNLGLFLYGFPGGLSNPVYRGQFRSSTTTRGFAPTYTAMTAYACFGHVPGPPINPVASPEIALTGNLRIARHGTMAAWDVTFNGTFLGAVPIADGKIGCIAVRRNGSNSVTVFTADALRPRTHLGPTLGPTTVSGAWSPTPITIGNYPNSILGVWSRLVFFSSARTDAQMMRDMEIIQIDLRRRGYTLDDRLLRAGRPSLFQGTGVLSNSARPGFRSRSAVTTR